MNNRRPIRIKRASIYSASESIDTTVITAAQAKEQGTTPAQLLYVARHHGRVANEATTPARAKTQRLTVAAALRVAAAELKAVA